MIREAFLLYQKLSASVGEQLLPARHRKGLGGIDFGPNACIELYETQLRWSDYYLKGINNGVTNLLIGVHVLVTQEWQRW